MHQHFITTRDFVIIPSRVAMEFQKYIVSDVILVPERLEKLAQ